MDNNIWLQIKGYLNNNMDTFLTAVKEHLEISLFALIIAIIIGIPSGYLCVKYKKLEKLKNSILNLNS